MKMENLRRRRRRGEIDEKTYREKAAELTILNLESIHYKYIGKLADGSHSVVVELRSPHSGFSVAGKIVLEEDLTEGEIDIWPKLIHNNILSQITWRSVVESWQNVSRVYFTEKLPKTVNDELQKPSFKSDRNGFKTTVSLLKDVTNAINYLHQKGYCYLNLDSHNVLISDLNEAKLCGFRYISYADLPVKRNGTTAVFKPPEVYNAGDGTTKVDGQKFDIWTLGILAIEMFTGQSLSKEVLECYDQLGNGFYDVYKRIFDILKKENFEALMKDTFPNCVFENENMDKVLNFITSCLLLIPEDRPTTNNLLKLELFGGSYKDFHPVGEPGIWIRKDELSKFDIEVRAKSSGDSLNKIIVTINGSHLLELDDDEKDKRTIENILAKPTIEAAGKNLLEKWNGYIRSHLAKDDVRDNGYDILEAGEIYHGKKDLYVPLILPPRRRKRGNAIRRIWKSITRAFTCCCSAASDEY